MMIKRLMLVLLCTCVSAEIHSDPPYTLQETNPGYDIFVRSVALSVNSALGYWNESGFTLAGANINGQLSVMSLVFGNKFTMGFIGILDGKFGFRVGNAGGIPTSE